MRRTILMKNAYALQLLSVLLMQDIRLCAQMLTYQDVMLAVGDTIYLHSIEDNEAFDPGPAGFGVVWDHTALTIVTDSYTAIASIVPETAPHHLQFPESDHVRKQWLSFDPAWVTYRYFDRREEGLFDVGSMGQVLEYVYDNDELVQAIPHLYPDTIADAYCYESTGLGVTFHTCGTTTQWIDGSGTLLMPYGTFTDVVRSQVLTTSVADSSPGDTAYARFTRWWAPGLGAPLMELYDFTGSNGTVLRTVTVLDPSSALAIPYRGSAGVRVGPNPARGWVALTDPALATSGGLLRIHAADGRLLQEQKLPQGADTHHIDLSQLPNGTLFLVLSTRTGSTTHRVVHAP